LAGAAACIGKATGAARAFGRSTMKRMLMLALLALPLLTSLGGCIVYGDGGYYHPYWHDRDYYR
jgi:hypothetical protein